MPGTRIFEFRNRVRTLISNIFIFANSRQEKFWLTRDECRLLYDYIMSRDRKFFGILEEIKQDAGSDERRMD